MSTLYNRGTRIVLTSAFAFLFLATQCAFGAASGSVSGRVLDRDSGEPLPGANVTIVGTSIGASTDLEGKYVLRNVPTGKQSMKVTYIGYRSVTMDVTVGENATLTQDYHLVVQAMKAEAKDLPTGGSADARNARKSIG